MAAISWPSGNSRPADRKSTHCSIDRVQQQTTRDESIKNCINCWYWADRQTIRVYVSVFLTFSFFLYLSLSRARVRSLSQYLYHQFSVACAFALSNLNWKWWRRVDVEIVGTTPSRSKGDILGAPLLTSPSHHRSLAPSVADGDGCIFRHRNVTVLGLSADHNWPGLTISGHASCTSPLATPWQVTLRLPISSVVRSLFRNLITITFYF